MGCFCKLAVDAMLADQGLAIAATDPHLLASAQVQATLDIRASATVQTRLVAAASAWLTARSLPAAPWQPDPAWLDLALPTPPLPAAALGVIMALVQASLTSRAGFRIDLATAAGVRDLTRLVATLNLRQDALLAMAADLRPWSELAALNAQVDTVRAAVTAGVFASGPELTPPGLPEPAFGVWQPFIAKITALAPLVAISRLLTVDLSTPAGLGSLGALLQTLAAINLPVLADATLVSQVIARASAIERLTLSLGRSPVGYPIERVVAAVNAKVSAVASALPPTLQLSATGVLLNAPVRLPNPSALVNAITVGDASRLTVKPLNWNVPKFDELPLLTSGVPAMAVAGLLGPGVIRATPCGQACDAGRVATLATESRGNGIGAAPAR